MTAGVTHDALLGGRVRLTQPATGYRAATDPVLLAAAVAARPGQRVLDIGCGAGAATLCLTARVPGLDAHGLEVQADYAALARRNAPDMTVWAADLAAPPQALKDTVFDWVMTNPPYYDAAGGASPDRGRDAARRIGAVDALTPAAWAAASLKRVRSGGRIAIIHLADKLPALLAGLTGAGDIAVLPLQARVGRPAKRILLTARKGAKGPFRLAAPLILHQGPAHKADADDFTAEAAAVLFDAAPLIF